MMISLDQLLEQMGYLTHMATSATIQAEGEHYWRAAYSCAIASMMLDGDLDDLPLTDWDE